MFTHLCYTYHVSPENRGGLHVLETELTQVDFGQAGILLRVRAGIPCGHFEAADLQLFDPVLLQVIPGVVGSNLMLLQKFMVITIYSEFK